MDISGYRCIHAIKIYLFAWGGRGIFFFFFFKKKHIYIYIYISETKCYVTNLYLQTASNKHVGRKRTPRPVRLCLNNLVRITVQYADRGYGITDLGLKSCQSSVASPALSITVLRKKLL